MHTASDIKYKCESCGPARLCRGATYVLIARLWRWHSGWCPGWKSYQRWKAEQGEVADVEVSLVRDHPERGSRDTRNVDDLHQAAVGLNREAVNSRLMCRDQV